MKKRLIALFTAAAVACTSTTAYAHDSDVFGGKYIDRTELNLFVRIHNSAESEEVFTFRDVYQYGSEWNGISSNVNLNVIKYDGVLTTPNQIIVYGANLINEEGNMVSGRIVPYDRYGKECGPNDDWSYSTIEINNTKGMREYLYGDCDSLSDVLTVAKKVFLHELGHALKLAHPVQSTTHTGYKSYDGYPYAIMNKGKLDKEACSSKTITDHDKSCLIAKWGK